MLHIFDFNTLMLNQKRPFQFNLFVHSNRISWDAYAIDRLAVHELARRLPWSVWRHCSITQTLVEARGTVQRPCTIHGGVRNHHHHHLHHHHLIQHHRPLSISIEESVPHRCRVPPAPAEPRPQAVGNCAV